MVLDADLRGSLDRYLDVMYDAGQAEGIDLAICSMRMAIDRAQRLRNDLVSKAIRRQWDRM